MTATWVQLSQGLLGPYPSLWKLKTTGIAKVTLNVRPFAWQVGVEMLAFGSLQILAAVYPPTCFEVQEKDQQTLPGTVFCSHLTGPEGVTIGVF